MGLPSFLCDAFYNASAGAYFCTSDPFLVDGDTDDNLNSATGVDYNELGMATEMRFPAGGGLWRHNLYYAWDDAAWGGFSSSDRNRRLAEVRVGTSTDVASSADSHNRLRLRHFYDSHGNLDVLHEQYSGGATDTHSFAYDDQNRLTDGFGSNTFAYDSSGRLTSFAGLTTTPTNSAPIHAPYKSQSFAYDANGNMVNKPFYTLTWDHENRLASATGSGTHPTESYLYDTDGMRVKKTSDGVETYYPFPHYELHDGVVVKYYFFNGMRVAQRRGSSTITYLHGNHLGSTVLETSVIGVSVNDEKYFAYGEQRDTGPVNTENQYTDQKRDDTGLYYYGARYYDPALGTFISPDTIVPNPEQVFGYNRFMYVYGNPLMYSDPSGHIALCFAGGRNQGGNVEEGEEFHDVGISALCQESLDAAGYNPDLHGDLYLLRNSAKAIFYAQRQVVAAKENNPYEPVIIVGYSWGGAAALNLAQTLNNRVAYDVQRPMIRDDSITVDLLFLVDPELTGRVVRNSVPDNVVSAVSLNAEYSAPVNRFLVPFQNGTDHIYGALNIELSEAPRPGGGEEFATHWSVVGSGPIRQITLDYLTGYIYGALWYRPDRNGFAP